MEYLRAKKLRQSSKAISDIVSGVQQLFASEMSIYESLNSRRLKMAQRVAQQLLNRDMVEINPDLTSALKPFGLISKPIPTTPPAEFRRL